MLISGSWKDLGQAWQKGRDGNMASTPKTWGKTPVEDTSARTVKIPGQGDGEVAGCSHKVRQAISRSLPVSQYSDASGLHWARSLTRVLSVHLPLLGLPSAH